MGKYKRQELSYFPVYYETAKGILDMTDEEAGMLIKILGRYAIFETVPDWDISNDKDKFFKFICSYAFQQIDNKKAQYKDTCITNAYNRYKRDNRNPVDYDVWLDTVYNANTAVDGGRPTEQEHSIAEHNKTGAVLNINIARDDERNGDDDERNRKESKAKHMEKLAEELRQAKEKLS